MNTLSLKKTIITTLTAATFVTAFHTSSAHADRRDFWAGVGAGVITGVVVNEATRDRRERRIYRERPVRRVSNWDRHVDWCYDEYRSYRERDNTYKPYGKRRRQCHSPYSR